MNSYSGRKTYKSCNIARHLIFLIIKMFVIADVGQTGIIITYYSLQFSSVLLIFFPFKMLNFVEIWIMQYRNNKTGGFFVHSEGPLSTWKSWKFGST